jgi:hypothetical protein
VNNDDGKTGEILAELCKEAADHLRELTKKIARFCDRALFATEP